MADEKGLSTKPQASVTQDGFTLSVSEVAYDGTRVSVGIERHQTENQAEKLQDIMSNIKLFINNKPVNEYAPSEGNSIGLVTYPGKDSDSAIIEFADLRNQEGNLPRAI